MIIMANKNVEESHVQAKLFTKLRKYDTGDSPFSLPIAAGCSQLNALVKGILFQDNLNEETERIQFDFLVCGEFLKTTLLEFITEKGLSTESVVEIEYILKEDSPQLDISLQHDDWISSVDLEHGHVLTGSYDNIVSLWNLQGKCITSVEGHTKAVKSISWVSWSQHESIFLSASQDQTILMWTFSPEHNSCVCKHICRGHAASVDCLAVQPSSQKFASGSWDKMIKIWETKITDATQDEDDEEEQSKKRKNQDNESAKITNRLPLMSLSGHKEPVSSLVWNDENELISAGWDHCIRLWDIESSTNKHTLTGNKALLSISYSNHNQLVASGSADKFVRLWDPRISDGVVVKCSLSSHEGWVSTVRWSLDNEYQLASGSYDDTVKVWDSRNTQFPLYDLEKHNDKVMCLCWKDSVILSGGADCKVQVYKQRPKSPLSSEE